MRDDTSAAELHGLLGEMLEHLSDRVRTVGEDWIRDGKDVTELTILIGVTTEAGRVSSLPRKDIARDLLGTHPAESCELVTGPRDKIPAVFVMMETMAIHVIWLDPIGSSEVH